MFACNYVHVLFLRKEKKIKIMSKVYTDEGGVKHGLSDSLRLEDYLLVQADKQ